MLRISDCAAYLYGTVVVGGQDSVRPGAELQHIGYQPAKKRSRLANKRTTSGECKGQRSLLRRSACLSCLKLSAQALRTGHLMSNDNKTQPSAMFRD
jgi:hypothetical protein